MCVQPWSILAPIRLLPLTLRHLLPCVTAFVCVGLLSLLLVWISVCVCGFVCVVCVVFLLGACWVERCSPSRMSPQLPATPPIKPPNPPKNHEPTPEM